MRPGDIEPHVVEACPHEQPAAALLRQTLDACACGTPRSAPENGHEKRQAEAVEEGEERTAAERHW